MIEEFSAPLERSDYPIVVAEGELVFPRMNQSSEHNLLDSLSERTQADIVENTGVLLKLAALHPTYSAHDKRRFFEALQCSAVLLCRNSKKNTAQMNQTRSSFRLRKIEEYEHDGSAQIGSNRGASSGLHQRLSARLWSECI